MKVPGGVPRRSWARWFGFYRIGVDESARGAEKGLNGVYMEVFERLLGRGCGESCAFYFGRLGELFGCEYFHIVTIW